MKLRLELLRGLMLRVEEETNGVRDRPYIDFLDVRPSYGNTTCVFPSDEVQYHLDYLLESGYIRGGNHWVSRLSPKGHDLLSCIRDEEIWDEVKQQVSDKGKVFDDIGIELISHLSASILRKALLQQKDP